MLPAGREYHQVSVEHLAQYKGFVGVANQLHMVAL